MERRKKESVSVKVTPVVRGQLKELAARQGVSVSNLCRVIIEGYFGSARETEESRWSERKEVKDLLDRCQLYQEITQQTLLELTALMYRRLPAVKADESAPREKILEDSASAARMLLLEAVRKVAAANAGSEGAPDPLAEAEYDLEYARKAGETAR